MKVPCSVSQQTVEWQVSNINSLNGKRVSWFSTTEWNLCAMGYASGRFIDHQSRHFAVTPHWCCSFSIFDIYSFKVKRPRCCFWGLNIEHSSKHFHSHTQLRLSLVQCYLLCGGSMLMLAPCSAVKGQFFCLFSTFTTKYGWYIHKGDE
jgi:hypothetical protein